MAIALLTNVPTPYRVPLYARLHERYGVEVVAYGGGGDRYLPEWFRGRQASDLPFPVRPLTGGAREAAALGGTYAAVIAPYAGGPLLPAAYLGARRHHVPFILWASVWAQPLSLTNLAALPVTAHMYRHADAVVAYGDHVRRFVARRRGRTDDVFVAPQSVEPELFGRTVEPDESAAWRRAHELTDGPILLYVGRLVPEKGVEVMLEAWARLRRSGRHPDAALVVIGDGPLRIACERAPGVRLLGPQPRDRLPAAYAAVRATVLASVPTRRFREPWGLVVNEAFHQGTAVIASATVGAVAGELVRDDVTGIVVPAGDSEALAAAMSRVLDDPALVAQLGEAGRHAVAAHTYDAMADAFGRALAVAGLA